MNLTRLGRVLDLAVEQPPSRLEVIAAAILYVLAVHWSYVVVIAPAWGHAGLVYQPAEDGSLIVALLAAVAPAVILPRSVTRVSAVMLWILFLVPYVPATVVPHYVLGDGWPLVTLNVWLGIAMVIPALTLWIPRPALQFPALSGTAYRWMLVGLAGATAVVLIASFGLGDLPGLAEIYETRAEYQDRAQEAGRLVGYLVGAAGSVVFPFTIVVGIEQRRWWIAAIGLAGVVLVYSITGYRSALFAVPLALSIYLVLRYWRQRFVTVGLIGMTGAIGIAVILDLTVNSGPVSALIIRRMLSVPGQLTGYYFEYFSDNPRYLLSHSVLGWLTDAPYDVVPPRLIAAEYFGNPAANANANLWADGFANFGVPGLLAASVLLGGLLVLADIAARDTLLRLSAPAFATAAFSLTNSALLTSLLSHGIVAALVLLALLPRAGGRRTIGMGQLRPPRLRHDHGEQSAT